MTGLFAWINLDCFVMDLFYCIADDIGVTGNDQSDHDANLDQLLHRCEANGIQLNSTPDKLQIRCDEMYLHGHVFTTYYILPAPSNVEAILKMPEPQDVHVFRRLCGMVQYLSTFVPLAETASPLQTLTHMDTEWIWSA